MKNILSILSLSLVILIGYSEESISQVNEVTQATQSNEADVKEFFTTIATIVAFSNPAKLYSYSDYFLYSKVYYGRVEEIQEILSEQANAEGTDRVNFLISGLRNYYKGCNFFVSAQQCANDSNAVIDDQMILQNVENNIDRLSPPCIRHTSELLTALFLRGISVDFEYGTTFVQKQNAIRDLIDDFSTNFEEEMRSCQARNSSSESNNNSDTADFSGLNFVSQDSSFVTFEINNSEDAEYTIQERNSDTADFSGLNYVSQDGSFVTFEIDNSEDAEYTLHFKKTKIVATEVNR